MPSEEAIDRRTEAVSADGQTRPRTTRTSNRSPTAYRALFFILRNACSLRTSDAEPTNSGDFWWICRKVERQAGPEEVRAVGVEKLQQVAQSNRRGE